MAQDQNKVDVLNFAKDVGSASAIALGLIYATGFLILHIHLGQVGIALFGLFNLTYLITGVPFAFSLALVWIPAWRGELAVRAHASELKKKGKSGREILSSTFPTRVIPALGGWLVGGLILNGVGVPFQTIVLWVVAVYIAHVLLRLIWISSQVYGVDWRLRLILFGLPSALFFWVGLCSVFALQVFPNIYREIGGGRPVRLELRIRVPSLPSGAYDVLAVTDRYWIIKKPSAELYALLPTESVESASFKGPNRIRFFR